MDKTFELVELKNISKQFPGVLALNNVSMDFRKGEVHVLLGENGAGKSTLVKIIAGVYTKDKGEMLLEGSPVDFKRIRDAQEAGIAIIHQELNLLPERSIAQNIFVGKEPEKKGLPGIIDKKKMISDSAELLQRLGVDLNPNTQVKKLSIAQQQMVEVVKALSRNIKLLIMDEPTSSLTKKEIDKLFEIIRKLKSDGIGIIYISHRMDEIQRIGDRVSIMRDGEYIDTVDAKTMNMDEVITKMVGRKIEQLYSRRYNAPGKLVLQTNGLCGLRFRNVSISVHAGEVVALSGLIGAGRSELAKALFGYDPIEAGSYTLFGEKVTRATPKESTRRGMAFLPEDRKAEGLILQMPIKNNIVSASLKKVFPNFLLNNAKETRIGEHYRREMRIATPNVDKIVQELSGGNQQKVVISKWLASESKFIIFDEPTRGIDIGAKAEIYQLIDRLAGEGSAILMISSELGEVVGISDRVYVMREGEVVAELKRDKLSQEELVSWAVRGAAKND
ncbi:MAG: sugar ABC transporter ATP-binding protein [Spirochaetales bacterium]|nr:sugar ABC transporter ATP-binding protein [Spirochaetales bacterium]